MPTRRARGIEEKIAEPLKLDVDRGGAGDRRDRDHQDVARGARGFGRQGLRPARLRAGRLRRRGPAACLRDRARAAHSDRDRAAVSLALLGARHAARRRAPRLHPHGLFRSRQRRFRQAREGARRDGEGRQGEPAPRQGRRSTRSSSTCAMSGQEFTLSVPVTLEQLKTRRPQGDPHRVRRALRASLRAPFAGRAGRDGQHPARRHRQAAEAELPEPRHRAARADACRASAQVYFTSAEQAAHRQVYRRDELGAGARDRRAGADPGARHHHGAVRERPAAGWRRPAN